MPSRFEANIAEQPAIIDEILARPSPAWFGPIRRKPITFIGIGSSLFAAEISAWLWRTLVSPRAWAVNSFDFTRRPQPLARGETAVLFSHSGGRSVTFEAGLAAAKRGAVTIGLTAKGSPWRRGLRYRLETCEKEEIEPFTKSLTAALACVAKLIGEPKLIAGLRRSAAGAGKGPPFPTVRRRADLVVLGDGVREWVARETALKLQEAARLPARAYGLEEFLHGPRFSVGPKTLVVAFADRPEKRWGAARTLLGRARIPFIEVLAQGPTSSAWLGQLFWGQRFTAHACRQLGADPDLPRGS